MLGRVYFSFWKSNLSHGVLLMEVVYYAYLVMRREKNLESNSTWQTNAWGMSEEYVRDAVRSGISFPVGMCLQDAGWRGGPWLKMSGHHMPVKYTLWSEYFDKYALLVSLKNGICHKKILRLV